MTLFVSALEASSNVHLGFLVRELKKLGAIKLCGVFSTEICADEPLFLPEDFSVMGFVDVLKKITFFMRAHKIMLQTALNADKILLMDSSSFNIPLAKKIKQINPNKEIMYYILPQVWAWKPWRARVLEKNCDKLAAILPFEIEMYRKNARFVGHPLLDEITNLRESFADSNADSKNQDSIKSAHNADLRVQEIISFMPGSRMGEISRIFPIFRALKDELKNRESKNFAPQNPSQNTLQNASQNPSSAQNPAIFYLIAPKHFQNKNLAEIYGDLSDFKVVFDAQNTLAQSTFAFICSGTATLECALIGTPFVLGYKAKWLDEVIVRCFLKIKLVGIANILYQKIHPNELFHEELLQDDLSVANLLKAYSRANSDDFLRKSKEIRAYLQMPSAKNVAHWLFSAQ